MNLDNSAGPEPRKSNMRKIVKTALILCAVLAAGVCFESWRFLNTP